jgi:mono/diheme cytochrome c family protein
VRRAALIGAWLVAAGAVFGSEPERDAGDARVYARDVRPLLSKYCFECHGEGAAKGRMRLDRLPPDFREGETNEQWGRVLEKLRADAMPPRKAPQPAAPEKQQVLAWVRDGLVGADLARQKEQGRVVFRRLNRVEYQNTVHDLLGIDVDLMDYLPEDDSVGGFDNNARAQRLSPFHVERYLEAADVALNSAIATLSKPGTVTMKYRYNIAKRDQAFKLTTPDGFDVFFGDGSIFNPIRDFRAPWPGRYRFRISAFAYQSDEPVTMLLTGGGVVSNTGEEKIHRIGFFEVPPGKPTLIEIVDGLPREGDSLRIDPCGTLPYSARYDPKMFRGEPRNATTYKGAGLAVGDIDIEGPLIDAWPPESHQRLFGSLPLVPVPGARPKRSHYMSQVRDVVTVSSPQPARDAENILRKFMPRAFRRPVAKDEIQPYLALVDSLLRQEVNFESAVRIGLKAVLSSPQFLFLREKPGPLDGYALASRLSYFLWSSMPDAELFELADKGRLADPLVLRAQAERLLRDPKGRRFTENFTGQWLGLRDINATMPAGALYPEFDGLLQDSSVRETGLFFEEVLEKDLSLLNFVDSEFTMLNERLALHYGIPGVKGLQFRRVSLPPGHDRGGVLTQASVLKVTANGTTTSPVLRGAWVLRNILGQPPPPPPANVSSLEPDIRGAVTIREQLARHRELASCASCHDRIDPPGFALEAFDAIGGRRARYRSTEGEKTSVELTKEWRISFKLGKTVDATGALPGGRSFRDVSEFRKLLLEDRDQIARCLAGKLIVYATGSAIRPADGAVIDEIVARVRGKSYGFRTLLHEVVQSRIFLNK